MGRAHPDNRLAQAVLAFKARFLTEALQAHGGNRVHTAKALSMSRAGLIRQIRALRLTVPTGRTGTPVP